MKRFFFVLFGLMIAMMSWEHQLTEANVVNKGLIPRESIRLRIIANSDSMQDQWLKQQVRDAIIAEMNEWATTQTTLDQARQMVKDRLPDLQKVVDGTIKKHGFIYSADVFVGKVDFPTKQYGAYVYPAGEYEALRIRIGKAEGQNWWCVLFPPLCFVDMSNGDAIVKNTGSVDNFDTNVDNELTESINNETLQSESVKSVEEASEQVTLIEEEADMDSSEDKSSDNASDVELSESQEVSNAPKVEIRSYFWDTISAWF
ncbi:stage II sporulation protein R [Brevibacillus daliensis]|uniref:stage II sporulation protein R n=1 Tax=Brevibacillus daliensis TaxID=2892995 RepID=UPI001E289CB5|nr:stage II sporulation protein R [Brevibacillus daliensis]